MNILRRNSAPPCMLSFFGGAFGVEGLSAEVTLSKPSTG